MVSELLSSHESHISVFAPFVTKAFAITRSQFFHQFDHPDQSFIMRLRKEKKKKNSISSRFKPSHRAFEIRFEPSHRAFELRSKPSYWASKRRFKPSHRASELRTKPSYWASKSRFEPIINSRCKPPSQDLSFSILICSRLPFFVTKLKLSSSYTLSLKGNIEDNTMNQGIHMIII